MITQHRLKELMIYNKDTGIFTRTKTLNGTNGLKVGEKIDKKGYAFVTIDKKYYKLHRLAWLYCYGEFPNGQIDHINQIKTDNRIENLRVDKDGCLNQSNKGKRKDCTSGFIGVNYNIDKQKWTARLQFYGKRKDICYKDTAYECALAREKYIIENNLPHTRNFND